MFYINSVSAVMGRVGFCQLFSVKLLCAGGGYKVEAGSIFQLLSWPTEAISSSFLMWCFEVCLVLLVADAPCERLEVLVGVQSPR